MLTAPPPSPRCRGLPALLRLHLPATALVIGLAGSCTGEDSPTDPGGPGAVGLYLVPSFAVSAADASALPINRIRYTVLQVPEGREIVSDFEDVDPSAPSWELAISVPLSVPSASVVVRTQLVHVDASGNEETQFAGMTNTIVLRRGATVEPESIDFVRGPLANLQATGVQVTSQLLDLVEGESRPLAVSLETDGTVQASSLVVYWTSLNPAVAGIDGTTLTATAPGTTQVVATVGALSDTIPVSVRGRVATVEITPTSPVVRVGSSIALSAVLKTADGTIVNGVQPQWSSGDATMATVDANGVVSGVGTGAVDITAAIDAASGSVPVMVVDYALDTVFASAGNTELIAGGFPVPATPHAYSPTSLLGGASQVQITSTGVTTTALGGTVDVEADGDFRYRPPAGLNVGDRDRFEVTLGDGLTSGVVVDVTGAVVWYVDNTAGPGGTGRSHDPFATLSEAQAAGAPGEVVHVASGNGTSSGLDQGITLLDGQHLLGAGVGLVVPGVGTLAAAGTPPVLTAGGGPGVTVASGNRVAGLRIENAAGAAIEANGVSGGRLDSLSIVAPNDAALRFTDAAGVWQSTDLDITSSSAAGGLVVLRGDPVLTLDLASSALENLTGAGSAVDVEATTGGSITVQGGDVRERGAGIAILNAAGGVRITSFLDVDSTSGPGIDARGATGAMAFDSVDIANNGSPGIVTASNPGTFDVAGRIETRGNIGWDAQCTFSIAPCGEVNARFNAFRVLNDGTGTRSRAWFMARTPAFVQIGTLDVYLGPGWQVGAAIQFLDMSYGGSLTITDPQSRVAAPAAAGLDILAGTTFGNAAGVNFRVDGALAYLEGAAGLGFSGYPHCLCGVDGVLSVTDGVGFLQVRSGSLDLDYGGASSVALDGLINSSVSLTGPSDSVAFTNSTNSSVLVAGPLNGTLRASGNTGSSIEATSASNVAAATVGPAVQIEDTEIGPASVTFLSVTATSAPTAPSPGIVLRGTGTAGVFTVTGTGAAGSGGSIDASAPPTSGVSQPAVLINGSTTAGAFVGARADLSWMNVLASADTSGIEVLDADATLRNTTVSGAATGLDVTARQPITLGVYDAFLSGTTISGGHLYAASGGVIDATIERSTFENGNLGLWLEGVSSTITGSLVQNVYSSNASFGLYASSGGDPAASVTATSTDETFTDNAHGARSLMGPGTATSGFVDLTLVRPTITTSSGSPAGTSVLSFRPGTSASLRVVGPAQISGYLIGVRASSASGPVDVDVDNVAITGSTTAGVLVESPFGSAITLRNNTIDGVTCGNGIRLAPSGGRHAFTIENNTIRNVACDHGIRLDASGPTVAGAPPTEYALGVVGNDVLMPATPGLLGMQLAGRAGRTVGCFDVRGNTAVGGTGEAGIGIDDDPPPAGVPVFLFERLLGGSGTTSDPAEVEAQLQTDNPGTTVADTKSADASGVPNGACATYFTSSNAIPTAVPGGPYVAEVGTSVVFDGSASQDPAPGRIVSYEWRVDGVSVSLSSAPTFQYTCSTESQFVVDLVVTDDRGETSTRSTLLDCRVTRFLARWLDAAGTPITSAAVGQVVELQVCFLEDDLTAFQATVPQTRWSFMARVDSVADFDNTAAGTHPDCAGTTDILTQVSASSDLSQNFTVTALSTAGGPGVGPQGILSLFFTFTAPGVFDDLMHAGVFQQVLLEAFDGNPPPFVMDLPDLTVN